MPKGNPIYNKRLSKFLPEDGCIRQGWENDTDSMPKVSLPIWGGEFWWSLGTPERFRVAIHYGYDRKEQIAKAIAVLFWKNAKSKFEVVDTLPIHSANDIIEVATTFDDCFEKEDTEISSQWKESMAGLYRDINIADNELQRTYATGDWGDWETSWDCADFDADEDATFLQDVVEIWRFMEIGDSTPWDTLKAYIRFQRGRNMFRAVTRDVIGEACEEDEARLNRVLEICQRKFNRTKSLKTKAEILYTEQLLLPELYEHADETTISDIQEEILALADKTLNQESPMDFNRCQLLLNAFETGEVPTPDHNLISMELHSFFSAENKGSASTLKALDAQVKKQAIALQWANHFGKDAAHTVRLNTAFTPRILAKADDLTPEPAYIFTLNLLENASNDATNLDDWYEKMRIRMMRTEDLTDLLTLSAALYEIEFYRRQSQTISDHYASSLLEDRYWGSDEEDW